MLKEVGIERDEGAEWCCMVFVKRRKCDELVAEDFVGQYEVVESEESRGFQSRSERRLVDVIEDRKGTYCSRKSSRCCSSVMTGVVGRDPVSAPSPT